MHVQYDTGCVLVRHGDLHRDGYISRPAHPEQLPCGLAGGDFWPCDDGPELSRSFRALKIWFAIKQHGTRRLGQFPLLTQKGMACLSEPITRPARSATPQSPVA